MKTSRAIVVSLTLVAACSGEPAVEVRESGGATGQGSPVETPEDAGSTVETAGSPATVPAASPTTAEALQAREVDATPGLVAELTEATRKDGVLTVKIRFRNVGTSSVYHAFETGHGDYSLFYVTAGDQKHFVLKDSEGAPLAPVYLNVSLDPGQTSTWWAKFPAPPAREATFDLVLPDMVPFEDVPIRDA